MKILAKIIVLLVFLVPFIALAIFAMSELGLTGRDTSASPVFVYPDMQIQSPRQPLTSSNFFPDSSAYRTPPEKSIPVGKVPYQFTQVEFDSAIARFTDPVPDCPSAFARGKLRFETFCIHCHGLRGEANGPVITQVQPAPDEEGFPIPPSYHRPETVSMTKSRIFHIISSGQNAMLPVADRLSEIDRWCIAKYVKSLQSGGSVQ